MANKKPQSRLQEDIVRLYLRLNGFFVTGFIVHSPIHGRNRAEIDALAIRMPHNSELEREIKPDQLLDLTNNYTDLVICEVKSLGKQLQFNRSLSANPDVATSVLRWSGLFHEEELPEIIARFCQVLEERPLPFSAPPTLIGPRGIRIRCLLFNLERNDRRKNQPWFITGPEVFDFIYRCLCPAQSRSQCSTTYDFSQWGDYEPVVRYFKERGGQGAFTYQSII